MNPQFLTVNFHTHTNYSFDGYTSFAQLYAMARRNNIDVLCITDHDTIEGAEAFKEWLREQKLTDLIAIVGEEVTCSDGTHIIGFPLKKAIMAKEPPAVVEEMRLQGAFILYPHPGRKDGILNSPYRERVLAKGDFYELFNAKILHRYNEELVPEQFGHLLPLGGSDAHYNSDIGKCVCYLERAGDFEATMRNYQKSRGIRITGVVKSAGGNTYFPLYYKYKKYIPLPRIVRNTAKKVFPRLKNYLERNKVYNRRLIYDNFKK